MSRIGKMPVEIPQGVEVKAEGRKVAVKGSKGELGFTLPEGISLKIEDGTILAERNSDSKKTRALHGLVRAILHNLTIGVSQGFEKRLEINGVGYRAEGGGDRIKLLLGFSHPVEVKAPDGIKIEIDSDKKNILIVSGIDKQKVGQVAANIRKFRPPEPYKGKGIKYLGEHIVRKAGKKAGAAKK